MFLLAIALLTATPTERPESDEAPVEDLREPTHFGVTFSPLSTFLLAVALEGEVRVNTHLTAYAAGEYYFLWHGWGAQTGARIYVTEAFHGFFVDLHARGSDLLFAHYLGGGLEIGSQHSLDKSHWTVMWAAGVDVGAGRWDFSIGSAQTADVGRWLNEGLVAVPKLRIMLGYTF